MAVLVWKRAKREGRRSQAPRGRRRCSTGRPIFGLDWFDFEDKTVPLTLLSERHNDGLRVHWRSEDNSFFPSAENAMGLRPWGRHPQFGSRGTDCFDDVAHTGALRFEPRQIKHCPGAKHERERGPMQEKSVTGLLLLAPPFPRRHRFRISPQSTPMLADHPCVDEPRPGRLGPSPRAISKCLWCICDFQHAIVNTPVARTV